MRLLLRAALLTSLFPLSFHAYADEEDVDDPVYLDGFVGAGGGVVTQLTDTEKGTREVVRLEFARLRKYIAIDFRVGFGQNYSDFGGMFRLYKHIKFGNESSTGISLGLGGGAMYSQGKPPTAGQDRQPFFDVIGAPFARFIWDWGNGVGMGFDLEYQLVPLTNFTNDTATDNVSDIHELRQRIMFGVSFLFEVE